MTQFATFHLRDRLFGLPILFVREIIRFTELCPVPLAPPQVRGLLNLRGQIVTILDLAVRLDLPAGGGGQPGNVIVLNAGGGSGEPGASEDVAGFLAEAIGDVVEADTSSLEPPPANVLESGNHLIQGVLKTEAGLLVLLDVRALLDENGPRTPSAPSHS